MQYIEIGIKKYNRRMRNPPQTKAKHTKYQKQKAIW